MIMRSMTANLLKHVFILVSGLGVLILSILALALFETAFGPSAKFGRVEGGVLLRTQYYPPVYFLFINVVTPILGGLMTGWMARNKSWIYSIILLTLLSPIFFFIFVVSAIDASQTTWTNPLTTYSLWFPLVIMGGILGEKLYKKHLVKKS